MTNSADADPLLLAAPKQRPEDFVAVACYFLLGAGFLAPWNAFITAADYFQSAYAGWHMDRLFTICYLPTCLLTLLATMNRGCGSKFKRIVWAFVLFFVIMLLVPLVDAVFVRGRPVAPLAALVAVLAAVTLVGVLDGLSQGAIFAEAASLPPKFTHAVVRGTASSGLIICLIRLATKAALPATQDGLRASTALYFALAAALSAACAAVYGLLMPRLPALVYYRERAAAGQGLLVLEVHEGEEDALLWANAAAAVQPSSAPVVASRRESSAGQGEAHTAAAQAGGAPQAGGAQAGGPQAEAAPAGASLGALLRRHWELAAALVAVYAVTLSIFPGFLAEDVHSAALGSWYPELLITSFNAADLVGKNLPHSVMPLRPRAILAHACSRLVYLPLFIVAAILNAHPAIMLLLTFALGLSNGYLTALAMTVGAEAAAAQDAEQVEGLLVVALVAGLNVGAFAGWLWLL